MKNLNKILLSLWKNGRTLFSLKKEIFSTYGQQNGTTIFTTFLAANKSNADMMQEFNKTAF